MKESLLIVRKATKTLHYTKRDNEKTLTLICSEESYYLPCLPQELMAEFTDGKIDNPIVEQVGQKNGQGYIQQTKRQHLYDNICIEQSEE